MKSRHEGFQILSGVMRITSIQAPLAKHDFGHFQESGRISCRTFKVTHGWPWRDSCPERSEKAGDVTGVAVESAAFAFSSSSICRKARTMAMTSKPYCCVTAVFARRTSEITGSAETMEISSIFIVLN